jgi:hypothetical protein
MVNDVRYVRYFADGVDGYCWLQLTGNESEIKLLDDHLHRTGSGSEISHDVTIDESEAIALENYGEIHFRAHGKFTITNDISWEILTEEEDPDYSHIKALFK